MENIEIGHACRRDIESDPHLVGYDVTRQALNMVKALPLQLMLVFLSDRYILRKEGSKEISRGILDGIQRAIKERTGGTQVPLIGITAAATIYEELANDSVMVIVLASKHLKAYVGFGEGVFDKHDDPEQPGLKKAVQQAFGSLGKDAHKDMSEEKPGFFLTFPPGYHTQDGERLNLDHEIHRYLMALSAPSSYIAGCSAADSGDRRDTSFQIVNDKILEGSFALAFIQTELRVGIGLTHGFKTTTDRFNIDKVRGGSTGNVVELLNGRNAAEVLDEMEIKYGEGQVLFEAREISDLGARPVVVSPGTRNDDGSLSFVKQLSQDMILTVVIPHRDTMTQAGPGALRMAADGGGLRDPIFALVFESASRLESFQSIGLDVEEIVKTMRGAYPSVQLMPVIFGRGEQGMDETHTNVRSSLSVAALVIDNELTTRAKREYDLNTLNKTSQSMLRSPSQIQAVRELLNGIGEIGYDGAMLSLVHKERNVIEAVDSVGEKWGKVRQMTIRSLEPELLFGFTPDYQTKLDDGEIPEVLIQEFESKELPLSQNAAVYAEKKGKSWLLTDRHDRGEYIERKEFTIRKDDGVLNVYKAPDVLAIVVRQNVPMVIQDSRGHPNCDQETISAGGIVAQAIIPLTPSGERPIGTLQVGISTSKLITGPDLEILRAFTNMAAGVIMQKRSLDELQTSRSIDQIIAECGAVFDLRESLSTFSEKVVRLIGADSAHVRLIKGAILEMVGGYGEYWDKGRYIVTKWGEWPTGLVAEKPRVIVVNDTDIDEQTQKLFEEHRKRGENEIAEILWRMKSFVSYPLIEPNETVIGTFNMESTKKYLFDETKRRLIGDLCQRVVPLIQNAQAFQNLQMLRDNIEELLGDTTSIGKLAMKQAEHLTRTTGADVCSIYVYDDDIERFVLKGAYGWKQNMIDKAMYAPHEGITGSIAIRDRIEYFSSVSKDESKLLTGRYRKQMLGDIGEGKVLDVIAMPLNRGGKRAGAITLHKLHEPGGPELSFREKNYDILRLLADDVQMAIESARQFVKVNGRVKELTILKEVGESLAAAADLRTILGSVAHNLVESIKTEACGIYIADDLKQRVILNGAWGYPYKLLETAFFERNEGITGAVFLTGQIMNLKGDIIENSKWSSKYDDEIAPLLPSGRYRSFISIPLKVRDEVIGVMNLVNRLPGPDIQQDWFSPVDERFLETLANQLALGIENIRLRDSALQLEQLKSRAQLGEIGMRMAHELNNPLQSILTALRVLQRNVKEDRLLLKHIEIGISQVKRAGRIVKNTLEFARRGRIERKELVDLKGLLEFALAGESISFDDHNIEVNSNNIESTLLLANKDALVQVFIDIIDNAIDAMPHGGTLTVETEVDNKEKLVRVRFRDTGVGMSEETRNRLFKEDFFTTKGGKGTGLGLFICRRAIEDHGGKIEVESELNRGATFTVSIPIVT